MLLERYLDQHYATASVEEQQAFAELLSLDDPDLYAICLHRQAPPEHLRAVFDRIRPPR